MCRAGRGSLGSPRTNAATPVSMRGGWTPVPAVPLSELSGSCPRARDPLQSSFALTPARSLSGAGLLPGFRSSSRHHRVRPLARGHPKPSIRSVRRCSQPLDGFLRAPALRACFIPQPRPGHFARSGALLLRAAAASSSEASCPLAVVRRAALQNKFWSPRSGALGFEALVHTELAPRRVGR